MSSSDHLDLPSPLDEIAEVAGLDAALAIADAVGGTRVNIPARAKLNHWLTDIVGLETATLVCDYFRTLTPENREQGAPHIIIPRGPATLAKKAKMRFCLDRENGMSVREAARSAGVHERTAFAWEAKRRFRNDKDNRQMNFFFPDN